MIQVHNLHKHFKVTRHHQGRLAGVRNLLTREYRLVKAVDNVSFTIQTGELVGYLGPNGAGKSTTIKMLTGLLVPTGGDLVVNGRIPHQSRQQYVANIGVVFGQRTTLWWDLPVIESLELLQHVYRVPADRFRQNLSEFTDLLDLKPFLHTPVRSLSLGQRMRADLCAALLHDPALLFLDEPTIGLDVVAKERIRQFIQHVNRERGTTIILTTHDLQDVEKLCERVMIIDHGRLLFDGQLNDLRERFDGRRELLVDMAEAYEDVSVEGAQVVARDGWQVTYQFSRSSVTASELISRISQRYRIRDLAVREPDIEATIRRIYEERLLET
ncbi:MAG: ABC transporter ATP-binding protein [Ardenticatenaceae bacterium]|nr:ATP-binding cassette domain-containing protein [Anaerolineales bacterium]MCB8919945.1 ABC transporter ATP-binding protein [Ardenticatenaceae bacterium]MCB8989792.1 ABC transporter ATP-binding protein [Ardenticatenaceae bacterium]MCB9003968.1 ABC transporter ATP-binding protein [Ardenticatenaceae bacterium]